MRIDFDEFRIFGWRMEECSPGGCFVELSIQLAIIFMGKQFVQSIFEYYLPLLWRFINWAKLGLWNFYVIQFVVKISTFSIVFLQGKDSAENAPQYVKDFQLAEWGHQALFYEYLEMVIQVVSGSRED